MGGKGELEGGGAPLGQASVPAPEKPWPVRWFYASQLPSQFVFEASLVVMPFLAKSIEDSFLAVGGLAGVSFGGLLAGSLLGGWAMDRFGAKALFSAQMAARALSAWAIFGLYASGALGFPALAALFGLQYFALGAGRIAERTLPSVIYGKDSTAINHFNIVRQVGVRLVGMGAPLLAGLLLTPANAFGPMLAVLAAVLTAGTAAAFLWPRLPREKLQGRGAGLALFPEAWRELRGSPTLRRAFWAAALVWIFISPMPLIVTPALGLYLQGGAAPAQITSWLNGLFSAGALVSTFAAVWLGLRAKRRVARLPPERRAAAGADAFVVQARRWLTATALTLLGLWTLAVPGPALGFAPAFVAVPLLGFTAVVSAVYLDTLLQNEAPARLRGTLVGVASAGVQLLTIGALAALGAVFQAFATSVGGTAVPTAGAFIVLGLAATAAAAAMLRLSRGFKTPENTRPGGTPDEPQR